MNELIGILIHAVTGKNKRNRHSSGLTELQDQLTSPLSTVLFSVDTLRKMLRMAKEIKGQRAHMYFHWLQSHCFRPDFGSSDETVSMHGEPLSTHQ